MGVTLLRVSNSVACMQHGKSTHMLLPLTAYQMSWHRMQKAQGQWASEHDLGPWDYIRMSLPQYTPSHVRKIMWALVCRLLVMNVQLNLKWKISIRRHMNEWHIVQIFCIIDLARSKMKTHNQQLNARNCMLSIMKRQTRCIIKKYLYYTLKKRIVFVLKKPKVHK